MMAAQTQQKSRQNCTRSWSSSPGGIAGGGGCNSRCPRTAAGRGRRPLGL
ncbi:MAG: hypothetical protein M0C28_37485 [Candidatus Moduliflexus flocculans]|nr:hypothetical protein [Candidatus Moduliflexus flocculans]